MGKFIGLGRGLDALMGDAQSQIADASNKTDSSPLPKEITADNNGTLWISPGLLQPNPKQPRKSFDEESLKELASSIAIHGVIEPVLIEEIDNKFFIVAGERRVRAAVIAGVEKIPVQIRTYSDAKRLEVALIENIQRTDLNPIEEAMAYNELMLLGDLTQEEVANQVGKARATVTNSMRLLKLPQGVQDEIIKGTITSGHAKVLLSLSDEQKILDVAHQIISDKLSVRATEQLVSKILKNNEVKNPPVTQNTASDPIKTEIASIEERFIGRLGTKVSLKGNLQKGSIVIDYYSREDLDRVYNILQGEHNG